MTPIVNVGAQEWFGRRNVILTGVGTRRTPVVHFEGPLSLKGVLEGAIYWQTPERRFRVWPDTFLTLNRGQAYSLYTDVDETCRTFCVFFEDGLVESAAAQLLGSPEAMLEHSYASQASFGFHERTASMSDCVGRALSNVATAVARRADAGDLDLLCHRLASAMALAAVGCKRRADGLPSVKASTRQEICRRLLAAQEAMEADIADAWTLKRMGAAAAMAPHHFARSFAQYFGEPPRRFLTRRRLERARALLAAGRNVTEACLDVGYESLSSFSAAYRKRFGEPPSARSRASRDATGA